MIAEFIINIFTGDKYIIALDRTCWKFGKKDINILFLAIVIGKVSVPIYWHLLDHGGACDAELMQDMLSRFSKKFGVSKIKYLLADREFMNKEWLKYLTHNNISFAIPLRQDMKVKIDRSLQTLAVGKSFNNLKLSEYTEVKATLWDRQVRLAAYRNERGELMVVASNAKIDVEIFALYRFRWAIERLFKHLKSAGFDIEKSHITINDRFAKLIAVCAIACALIVKYGLIKAEVNPIKTKKFKNVEKQIYSLFTYGIDHLKLLLKQAVYKAASQIISIFKTLKNINLCNQL